MTLGEAREHIGAGVIYHPGRTDAEGGVITSVNDHYVFVRYGSGGTSAATEPDRTRELGNLLAEVVRACNYATLAEAPGLAAPCDAYELIGAVKIACERLPQLLAQTGAWLGDQDRRRPLGDSYARIEGHPQDVHEAVYQATGHLGAAVGLVMQLAAHLREAHNLTGGLYVKDSTKEETGGN